MSDTLQSPPNLFFPPREISPGGSKQRKCLALARTPCYVALVLPALRNSVSCCVQPTPISSPAGLEVLQVSRLFLILGLVPLGMCLGMMGCGQIALKNADREWEQGNKEKAIELYSAGWLAGNAEPRRPAIVKKVVEYLIETGKKDRAREWIEKALGANVAVTFESEAATELLAEVQEERKLKGKALNRPE